MAKLTQIALVLLFCSLQQCLAAPFSLNSFNLVGKLGSRPYMQEYSYDGTFLQNVTVSQYTDIRGADSLCPRADSLGTSIILPLYGGTVSVVGYGYIFTAQAELGEYARIINPGASISEDIILEGKDIWMKTSNGLYHMTRGVEFVPSDNLLPNIGSRVLGPVQLVGTRLFVLLDDLPEYMDPVILFGSGTTTPINGTAELLFFFMHGLNVMYGISANTLIKYSVTDAVATKDYDVAITGLGANSYALNCYSMDVDGTRYVFVVSTHVQGPGSSRLQRFTDDGSAFVDNLIIAEVMDNNTFVGVGPSAKPTCTDGYLDQDESDIDCGGMACSKCINEKNCTRDSDCESTYCSAQNNTCVVPTCFDGVKNGNETGVDCGEACCKGCLDGEMCDKPVDCLGLQCENNLCIANCIDTIQNQAETDVDCGGPNCKPCLDGKKCLVDSDCNEYCNPDKLCSVPSCIDGFMNQDETDIDCGGSNCPLCAIGKVCKSNSDCQSNICVDKACVNATPTKKVSRAAVTGVEMSIIGLLLGVITLTF